MTEPVWEPPGKGAWEIEATHMPRALTRFLQKPFCDGMRRGFQEGTARYGLLLDHLEQRPVNDFIYVQPVAFGAPPGASGPPPAPVLWLLTRLHPKLRARIAVSGRAFASRLWREDLRTWDDVDKPAAIARHRAIQAVDVSDLDDDALAAHILRCRQHNTDSTYLHHKYTVPAIVATGDFLAGAMQWTDAPAADLLALLRGSSPVSNGFAADELEAAAKAIATSDPARDALQASDDAATVLALLRSDPVAGGEVGAYLDAVRYRSLGYDVCDPTAEELPEQLVGALRAAVNGASAAPVDRDAEARMRERVPAQYRDDFDDRLAEARAVNRLRDERGQYSDGWATGLSRRALLEAGRRLTARGALQQAAHAVDMTADECAALLRGEPGPDAGEVAARFAWRTTHTVDDAPPHLGGTPAAPPSPSLLPPAARRAAAAVDAVMGNLFGVPDVPNTATVLHGLPVNDGVYEGTARLVSSSDEFGRIRQGDILVTRNTSPYFNVVLPLLGAIVTDRGGQLSHAAIVAREYGIPGIVGTRDATHTIPDGARIRVDGGSGEVHLLS